MSRPGVMLYFDMVPALQYLNYEQKGRLLDAILRYAEHGENPGFDDPMLNMAWYFVVSRIDKDGEVYDGKIEQRRYAGYCSAAKKKELTPLPLDEWRELTAEEQKRLMQ